MGGSYYSFPCSILSTGKDLKTPQQYPDVPTTSRIISLRSMDSFQGLTQKIPHHGIDLWLQALLEDLALYDNESWNDPRDFAKPVKAISLPQDVPSTSDRRLIELEHQVQCLMEAYIALMQPTQENKITSSCEICIQVQCLMEAYIAPMQPTQENKITSSCEICSGPRDTQYCMENPEQAFVEYASSRTDEAGEDEQKREGNPKNTNAAERKEEQRDAPQAELKDPTDIKKTGPKRHDEERSGSRWIRRIQVCDTTYWGFLKDGYAVSSLMDTAYWSSE
ncbi:hypothetical protein Tco_0822739 [Tanacetum coccineum]|uniref:MAK10-like protein n=1 Tax=Tanacetum coccineum TaxID=301880 RepID=A0ABQ5AFX3_9ASTR